MLSGVEPGTFCINVLPLNHLCCSYFKKPLTSIDHCLTTVNWMQPECSKHFCWIFLFIHLNWNLAALIIFAICHIFININTESQCTDSSWFASSTLEHFAVGKKISLTEQLLWQYGGKQPRKHLQIIKKKGEEWYPLQKGYNLHTICYFIGLELMDYFLTVFLIPM